MSITFTGGGGLFTRLGRWGRVLLSLAEFRADGLGSEVSGAVAEYDLDRDLASFVTEAQAGAKQSAGALASSIVRSCQLTVLRAVEADQPARSWTLDEAVAEVSRQMDELGETVPQCLTSVSATALTPFAGDGLVHVTNRGRDGEPLENLFAETLWLTCEADAQDGGATRYRERFRFRGGVAEPDPWSDAWPAGSGGSASVEAADPATRAPAGNQLENSSFDAFTSNVPDDWVLQTGAAGTEVLGPAVVNSYDGVGCLQLPGSATLAALYQTFGVSTGAAGTTSRVMPSSRYGVSVRTKVSAAPSTGTLILELTDGSNNVVTDEQGSPLRLTVDLTAETTAYAAHSAAWVTPRALPTTCRFRVRVGTAIQTGKTAYADHLCLAVMREAYPGGPAAAAVSGVTPFVAGDGWQVAAENDRASQPYAFTWQAFWDRLFGTRFLGVRLPSGSPATIDDPLITS